jgi:hypothetical protein
VRISLGTFACILGLMYLVSAGGLGRWKEDDVIALALFVGLPLVFLFGSYLPSFFGIAFLWVAGILLYYVAAQFSLDCIKVYRLSRKQMHPRVRT